MCCSPVCPGLAGPPSPASAVGRLLGLGKAKLPKLQWLPLPSGRLGVLPPLPSLARGQCLEPRPRQRALGRRSQWPSLTCPAGLESPAWPVSISCLHTCRPLGPLACRLAPRLGATIPSQALPGPSQDNCGTKLAQLEPSPLPPPHPLPGQAPGLERTGACPCFSFSDREINSP